MGLLIACSNDIAQGPLDVEPQNVHTATATSIATQTPTQISTPEPTPTPSPLPTVQLPLRPAEVSAQALPQGVEQWRDLVGTIWPPEAVDKVLRIMTCESNGNKDADGIGGTGLMQINDIHGDYDWKDPVTNLTKAYALSRGGTQWWHWDGPTPGRGEAWANGEPCSWKP